MNTNIYNFNNNCVYVCVVHVCVCACVRVCMCVGAGVCMRACVWGDWHCYGVYVNMCDCWVWGVCVCVVCGVLCVCVWYMITTSQPRGVEELPRHTGE